MKTKKIKKEHHTIQSEDVEEELKRCSEIVELVNEEKVDPTERLTNRAYLIAF